MMREEQLTSSAWDAPAWVVLTQRQRIVLDLLDGSESEAFADGRAIPGCKDAFEFDIGPSGSGRCRVYRFSNELCLAFTDKDVTTPMQLRIFGDELVTIRIMLTGRTRFHGDKFEPIEMRGPLVTVFNHRQDDELLHEIAAGPQRIVTLIACPDYLRRELGWSFDNDNSAPMLLPLTGSVERMAREVIRNGFSGARHGTFVRARALDILCALASEWDDAAARDPEAQRLTARDRERIYALREQLNSFAHHPPSMSQLSRLAGMNKTKLMRGFKQIFGETIADFCRRSRLEEAHALLLAQRLSIGEVAAAVGYQHQSSFTAAFSAHFGFPPKMVLRPPRKPSGSTRDLN